MSDIVIHILSTREVIRETKLAIDVIWKISVVSSSIFRDNTLEFH